jgi:hypothetical protein
MHTPSPDSLAKAPGTTEEVRREITQEVTRLIAATALADSSFPRVEDLPRIARVPYHHLGHQVLLDHDKLAGILWGTVHEIQESYRSNPWRFIAPLVGLVLAAASILIGIFALSRARDPGFLPIPIIIGCLIALAVYRMLSPKIEKIAAEVRGRNLRLLLRGVDPSSAEQFRREKMAGNNLASWGDGAAENRQHPVIVLTSDSDPFPGYGRHQARELYVCRPDDAKEPPALSPEMLNDAVSGALVNMARNSGISCVSVGKVVLIDGRTLRRGSAWLGMDEDNPNAFSPPLFVPENRLFSAPWHDERASVRVYTCIQAIVPEYLMCVTFFVRTFLAGNSAACEVNVTTLGPPFRDWDYIRDRLRIHDREQGESRPNETAVPITAELTPLGTRLHLIGVYLEIGGMPFKNPGKMTGVMKIKAFDKAALVHEEWQAKRISEGSELWPGLYTRPVNWRENYSITFTTDFFGNTESRAILKTLYDRICRSALCQLKELGFDISDYQDESGRFTLQADSIEQLVVGERVFMEPKAKKSAEKEEASKSGSETAA